MMFLKSKYIFLLAISLLVIVILYSIIYSNNFENFLKKEGVFTYGKVDSLEKFPKTANIHVTYYINGKKYNSFESAYKKPITKNDVGNFYRINFLETSPKIIRGQYDKKITDTILLLKALFSRDDLAK